MTVSEPPWLMRIEAALDAHFFQADGRSRPGTDWAVGLKHGEATYRVTVRAYLSNDLSPRWRGDREYQGRTVMGYLNDLIEQGWRPDQPRDHTIVIANPAGQPPEPPPRPWWRFWS